MSLLGISATTWFPVVTLIIGLLLKGAFDVFADNRRLAREQVARLEQFTLEGIVRRNEFQRTTLLELQLALEQVSLLTMRAVVADREAFEVTSVWKKNFLGEEINEPLRASMAQVNRLTVRIRHDDLREALGEFRCTCDALVHAQDEDSETHHTVNMAAQLVEIQHAIGTELRRLDDVEEQALRPPTAEC